MRRIEGVMRMACAALGLLLVGCAAGLAQQYAISTYAGRPPVTAATRGLDVASNDAVRVLRPTNYSALIGAVVEAASQRPDPVSPQKTMIIRGAGLGPRQMMQSSGTLGITELGGTRVSFNGSDAQILSTPATQVEVIAPYLTPGATAQVTVTYQAKASNSVPLAVAASAPSLFTLNQAGWGQAAGINAADGTVNTAVNPVKIGDYISLYATGEGQSMPLGVDGKLGDFTPTQPLLPVSATVDGIPATVQYAGGVLVQVAGLIQVNVRIPRGVHPGGYVPVVLQVGRTSSPAVSIAVSGTDFEGEMRHVARLSAATPVRTSAAIPASTWTEINDGLPRTAAGIGNLAMDSAARSTIYARMNSGAIFKSPDGGERWSQISSIAAVRWLVVDPSNPSTIYAGTIHGIVKSTDGGASWNGVNGGLPESYVNSLVIDPLTPSTLYAPTSGGDIFKSVDGGGSWNVIGTLDGVSDLAIHPTNPSIMYAAAAGTNAGGLFKSTDSGATWSAANPGRASRIAGIHLAFDPVTPSTIYLAYIDYYETPTSSVPVGQIAKSTDGGSSWNPVNTGLFLPRLLRRAVH